jgi:uncharacterized protein
VQKASKMAEVFLDTAYAIALSSVSDLFHHWAVLLADQLEVAGTRLVTTQAVLLEIGAMVIVSATIPQAAIGCR